MVVTWRFARVRHLALAVALVGLLPPASVHAQNAIVLHAFGIGDGPGNLGFTRGDVQDYDVWPFFDVGPQGHIVVADSVNDRILVFASGVATPTEILTPASTVPTLDSVKAISGGEVIAVWQGTQRVTMRYSPTGAILARRDGVLGSPVGELPDSTLLFALISSESTVYERTDKSLTRISVGHELPSEIGKRDMSVTSGVKIVTSTGCYMLPLALRGSSWSIQAEELLAVSNGEIGKVTLATRALTLWQLPRSVYSGGPGPDVEGPDADARRDVVVEYGGPVIGEDGNFYSLVHRPTSFEIVRWNLAELPSQTYPAPSAGPPPQIDPIPDQTATVGQELEVVFRAHDANGKLVGVKVSALPQGAKFQARYGAGRSVVWWKPRADQVGVHDVTVVADDGKCQPVTRTFRITVQ